MPEIPTDYDGVQTALLGLVESARTYDHRHEEASRSGGWWNPSPLTRPPSIPAVDPQRARRAGVLVLLSMQDTASGPRLLLTERAAGLRTHPGEVSFPGGSADPDDTDIVATALRESQEETALNPQRVVVLGTLPPAPVPVSGFMVTPVLAISADPGQLQPSETEVARVLQLPVAQLLAPQARSSAVVVHQGRRLSSPGFATTEAFVWGFTGILLDRIMDRLGWAPPWDASREVDPRQLSLD